ncbi:hypothetical protein ACFE04_019476 [Oxalis oulophora]
MDINHCQKANQEMPPPVISPSPSAVDVIADDSKLMELMDISMSSARKGRNFLFIICENGLSVVHTGSLSKLWVIYGSYLGKKGESCDSTEFSYSPVDKLIVEITYVHMI